MTTRNCRFCKAPLVHVFCDLGMSPFANSLIKEKDLDNMEPFYPLRAYVCSSCYLTQIQDFQSPEEIFSDYPYFSSYSKSMLAHAQIYVEEVTRRFDVNSHSLIVEIGSNDGYLLHYFQKRGMSVLGIEPAKNVADTAIAKGIPTLIKFFSTTMAQELVRRRIHADLLIGNNVLAHVPDLNDFVKGLKILLKSDGILTMEFPHLIRLIEGNQFDTVYHEHFSYFSLCVVEKIFLSHGLRIFDLEQQRIHGGSLRIYACHTSDKRYVISNQVLQMRKLEQDSGIYDLKMYERFNDKAKETKRKLLEFLTTAKNADKKIVGYGAPAKGNTLLNFCGIRRDFIDYTVDLNPHKIGHYLPGSRLPIYHPEKIEETQPDYVLILPWNLKSEIIDQISFIRHWGGQFVIPIPYVEVIS